MSYGYEQLVPHKRRNPYAPYSIGSRQSSTPPIAIPEPEVIPRVYEVPPPLVKTREFVKRSIKEGWRFGEKYIMELKPSEVEATLKFYRQAVPDDPVDAKRKLCKVLEKMHRISILDK